MKIYWSRGEVIGQKLTELTLQKHILAQGWLLGGSKQNLIFVSGKDAKNMVADEFSRDCRNLEK